MGKDKLQRFAENKTFENLFQPSYDEVLNKDYKLKGKWNKIYFKNTNPVILELGCGKGEYTIALSQKYKNKNFIGIDIKGARLWRGAKTAIENNFKNVAFLRTRIEFITSFFAINEVSEIWITFPDPQMRKRRAKKRLTSSRFLGHYQEFLTDNGIINLKTDNDLLYNYTKALLEKNNLKIIKSTNDLYSEDFVDDILSVKTFYEKQFLSTDKNINYIKFELPKNIKIQEPDEDFFI